MACVRRVANRYNNSGILPPQAVTAVTGVAVVRFFFIIYYYFFNCTHARMYLYACNTHGYMQYAR